MNISISSIFAGLLFGAIGLFLIKSGRQKSDMRLVVIGILMLGYGYFTKNAIQDWGIGAAFCGLAYKIWN